MNIHTKIPFILFKTFLDTSIHAGSRLRKAGQGKKM